MKPNLELEALNTNFHHAFMLSRQYDFAVRLLKYGFDKSSLKMLGNWPMSDL